MAQNRDNIIKYSINSLQLLYHANPCNRVLQVLQTTSLVDIVFPYSGPGVGFECAYLCTFKCTFLRTFLCTFLRINCTCTTSCPGIHVPTPSDVQTHTP